MTCGSVSRSGKSMQTTSGRMLALYFSCGNRDQPFFKLLPGHLILYSGWTLDHQQHHSASVHLSPQQLQEAFGWEPQNWNNKSLAESPFWVYSPWNCSSIMTGIRPQGVLKMGLEVPAIFQKLVTHLPLWFLAGSALRNHDSLGSQQRQRPETQEG